jgi:peptide/nickel transport system permease protein
MHVRVLRELKKDILGKIGLALIAVFIIFASVCPFMFRDPGSHSQAIFEPPSSSHLLGTNDVGQDIWSRLAQGTRTSVLVAIGVGFLSTLISTLTGISAGIIGGICDKIIMRLVDALLVIPTIVVLILVASFVNPSVWILIVLISLLHWQGGARVIRSQTLALKERMHISAARTFGAGRWYIIFRHIIPDLGPILIVSFIHRARMAVFMEAGLAFIGIADPLMISWGMMMHHALKFYYLPVWKWWLLPPGISLSLLIMSFTFLGHSLEKIMEPRLRNA